MDGIKITHRRHDESGDELLNIFGVDAAERARSFHKSIPGYSPTPLVSLGSTANSYNIAGLYIKDESRRFGLNAFKVLGGSYALAKHIAERLGEDTVTFERLVSDEVRQKVGDITFVTATDGNHGRGIAWTAQQMKQHSVVYMPKGSSAERLENIRRCGSDACITELSYDDTVRLAGLNAEKNGWVLTQDTAWDGYETIPTWIMQGYTTMALEATEQLGKAPTHVFLQAGVGSMSGALTSFFADRFRTSPPIITIVEPEKADCVYRTATADDGRLHRVTGDMDTIMAGLACGEVCPIGWDSMRRYADFFVSVPDAVAEEGMRMLAHPPEGDVPIVSGESGAVTAGLVMEILKSDELRTRFMIDEGSVILCFSTEGATNLESYRRIVGETGDLNI